jgi:hypothetical protein
MNISFATSAQTRGRVKALALAVGVLVSVGWTVLHSDSALASVRAHLTPTGVVVLALGVLVSEILFVGGAVMLAIGLPTREVALAFSGSSPRALVRGVRHLCVNWRQYAQRMPERSLARWGLTVNWVGALGTTGLLPIGAIAIVLPVRSWGLMAPCLADLVATCALRIPILRATAKPRTKVRQARGDADLQAYAALQVEAWKNGQAADIAQLRSRFATDPRNILVAEVSGRIVGAASTMRLANYDYAAAPSWHTLSDDGHCFNHVPRGKIVYGIDLSVARNAPPGTVDDLMAAIGRYAIASGATAGMLGGRMPRYAKHARNGLSPDEYMRARTRSGRYLDPEIELYSKIPGLKIVQLLPNYFDDADSLNYGVLLEWKNQFHRLPGKRLWGWFFEQGLYRLEKRYQRRHVRRSQCPLDSDVGAA